MSAPHPSVAQLRAAAANPTLIDLAGYAFEKVHTRVLAQALNSNKKTEARHLAAALWHLASHETIQADQITSLSAVSEYRLGHGRHSKVDLFVELTVAGQVRQLAVEVKVDGPPMGTQLATMAAAMGSGTDRRLVLLALGAAQVSRLERRDLLPADFPRWGVADMLKLAPLIESASSSPAHAQAWHQELEREEMRRLLSFEDEAALENCGYRDRLLHTYRYRLAADALRPDGGSWQVSIQPFGVVLTAESSHHVVPFSGTDVTLYLEVADQRLRVKAGAWYDPVDPRAATDHLLPWLIDSLQQRGLKVTRSRRTAGESVSLLNLDAGAPDWPLAAFVSRLRSAHAAWESLTWPS